MCTWPRPWSTGGACSSGFCTKTASTAARSRAWTLLWIPDRYVVVQVSPGASVQAVWPLSGPNLEPGPVALSPGTGQLFVALHPYNDQADLYIVDLLMPGPDGVSLYDPTNAFGQDWLPAVSAMAAAGGGLWMSTANGIFRLSDGAAGSSVADPPLAKIADRAAVQIGDVITDTITFDNATLVEGEEDLVPQVNVWIRDVLPPGFAYVPGSSYVYPAGASGGAPPVQAPDPAGGATLYWQLASAADPIPAGGVRSLTYQVMVTPRAAEGVIHTNTAQGFADGDGDGRFGRACAPGEDPLADGCDLAVTPVARADVLVTPGVFSPRAHVVGKVFLDVDGDGRQSAAAPHCSSAWAWRWSRRSFSWPTALRAWS